MRQFAETAIVHAQQEHGVTLDGSPQSVADVDAILDAERDKLTANVSNVSGQQAEERRQMLSLCYGSWLGEVAVAHFGGTWVGLAEPQPPRISIAGVLCSPIDAVASRLANADAPTLVNRAADFQQWAAVGKSHADLSEILTHNQTCWEQLATEARFADASWLTRELPTAAEAVAALDPWLTTLDQPISQMQLLCLAAGGGTHSVLPAVAGAKVTVVDISKNALAIDQQIAEQHRLPIATIQASLTDLSEIADASFDVVLQPVSSCYVPDILPAYREVARVLREGGWYLSQHKQPASQQAAELGQQQEAEGYLVTGKVFSGTRSIGNVDGDAAEFVHPLAELIGGLCQNGFVIEDFQEPPRADAWAEPGSRGHRACYLPPYLKIKARRK